MRTSRIPLLNVLWLAFTLAVVSPPPPDACAQELSAQPAPPIAGLISPGDAVTLTLWAGGKIRGVVAETTDCTVVVRTARQPQAVPLWAIKTLRLHKSRPDNAGARAALEMGGQCDDVGCLPVAFFYVGIGAIIQGVDDLAHPPKVVYRAPQRLAPRGACVGHGVVETVHPR